LYPRSTKNCRVLRDITQGRYKYHGAIECQNNMSRTALGMPRAARSGDRDSIAVSVAETVSNVLIGQCRQQEAVPMDLTITDPSTLGTIRRVLQVDTIACSFQPAETPPLRRRPFRVMVGARVKRPGQAPAHLLRPQYAPCRHGLACSGHLSRQVREQVTRAH
jgi:hypothetical protein